MAVLSFTIPDDQLPRVVDALCADRRAVLSAGRGWTAGSGLTRAQFARRALGEVLRDLVRAHEADAAAAAARAAAGVEVEVSAG